MKRFFVGVIFFLLVSIGFSEEFDLGAIEVTDISAKLDANALEKDKVKALEKENLNIDYKGSDLGNRQKIADELVPDVPKDPLLQISLLEMIPKMISDFIILKKI